MPLSPAKATLAALGRGGLWWGGNGDSHRPRGRDDRVIRRSERQVSVDELGTIPNLRGGEGDRARGEGGHKGRQKGGLWQESARLARS